MPKHLSLLPSLVAFLALFSIVGTTQSTGQNLSCHSIAKADADLVRFESLDFKGEKSTVEGIFMKATVNEPRPAIVLLPTYFGIETPECYRWIQLRFQAWGYHSLLIDHASPKNYPGKRGGDHTLFHRLADVEGAVAFLQSSPGVKTDSLAIVGWSQGALSALHSLDRKRAFRNDEQVPVKSVVAYYPTCPIHAERYPVPVLAFHGSNDTAAPVGSCERLANTQSGFDNFRLVVFSDVGHQFDQPTHKNFDRVSANRAQEELKRFLELTLGEHK